MLMGLKLCLIKATLFILKLLTVRANSTIYPVKLQSFDLRSRKF